MTQQELADASGVSRVTIVSLETGAHGTPEGPTLEALADALRVAQADLLAENGESEIAPLLDAYLASPVGKNDAPTLDEIEAMRSVGVIFWLGGKPTVDSLHYLLLSLRLRHR